MITSFRNKYFFLSNFYGGMNALEYKYQAEKFLDPVLKQEILNQSTPGRAKRKARELKIFQRLDWENVSIEIMYKLLKEKFSIPFLAEQLLETENEELIEGNDWNDKFWGCVKNANGEWIGENNLGKLLMEIRKKLKESK